MLDIKKAIRVERRFYGGRGSTIVYIFLCSECNTHEIKSETKYLNKHTGKCKYCVHKGVPFLSAYKHLKDGVKRTNEKRSKYKSFTLTFEEFLEFTKQKTCHYCNSNIKWIAHSGKGQHRYNLDRKDSSIGYEKENLVVCCKRCNYMKGSEFSYDEFVKTVELLNNMRDGQFKLAKALDWIPNT